MSNESSILMAKRLKELREEKKISHVSLSKAIKDKYGVEISRDSLMGYEVSDPNHTKAYKNEGMRVEYLRCLADFYGVSADYLLGFTNEPKRQSCAADQLGLSSHAIQNIVSHNHIPQTMHGLNTLLESEKFMCFLSEIYLLSCYIGDEIERVNKKASKITTSILGESKMLHISGNDAYIMRSLADELIKSHPDLNGRIVVSYGSSFIKTKLEEIKSDFDLILKETTGYMDLQELQSDLENDYVDY